MGNTTMGFVESNARVLGIICSVIVLILGIVALIQGGLYLFWSGLVFGILTILLGICGLIGCYKGHSLLILIFFIGCVILAVWAVINIILGFISLFSDKARYWWWTIVQNFIMACFFAFSAYVAWILRK